MKFSVDAGSHVSIVAGKQSGELCLLRLKQQELSKDELQTSHDKSNQQVQIIRHKQAHGYLPITSVTARQLNDSTPQDLQIRSTGIDGFLRVWRCSADQVEIH